MLTLSVTMIAVVSLMIPTYKVQVIITVSSDIILNQTHKRAGHKYITFGVDVNLRR